MIKPRVIKLIVFVMGMVFLQEMYHLSQYFATSKIGSNPGERKDSVEGKPYEQFSGYDFINSPMGHEFRVTDVDCKQIIEGNRSEILKGSGVTPEQLPEAEIDLSMYMELKFSCSQFKTRRGYIQHYLTEEERDFPIAVSLLLFKEFDQVERLLRTIYRPQNYYCLHVDLTSDPMLHALVRAYVDCFDNVIMPRDVVDIVWSGFSLSEGEFVCMWELLKNKKWKYFINLTGQEYPLKTNLQMVKIFKAFKGANDLWTSPLHAQGEGFGRRWNRVGTPPHGIKIVKGSSHITFSRSFVEFILSDPRIPDLITFLANSAFPEESLWTSMNNDPTLHAPGGFNGTLLEAIQKPWFGRVKWWASMKKRCSGRYTRSICIFGVGDIHRIANDTPILANKFYWDHQPMALACLQEWIFNRTRDEYLGRYTFDMRQYLNRPNVLQMYRNDI